MRSRGSKSETPGWNPLSKTNLHAVFDPTRKNKNKRKRLSKAFVSLVYVRYSVPDSRGIHACPWLRRFWRPRVSGSLR